VENFSVDIQAFIFKRLHVFEQFESWILGESNILVIG